MRGLTIVLLAAERLDAALTLLMAQAALGGRARLFCQDQAVRTLATLSPLIEEALALGVELIACQTALAAAGMTAAALDARVTCAGPVSLLQGLGEDRLMAM